MTVRELREKYLAFFESKGHRRFPSGSLVPIDVTGKLDESLLFNGAGMIQFKPYFRGIATPEWPKLTTVQKCVRTNDIDEVGDATHLSFFEMLGNFSFGDYFKAQAIDYSWEFLTSPEWLGLDKTRLAFTVFETDDEAYDAWAIHLRGAGIDPETRVFRLGEETNYWPAGAFSKGPPGPCGPNSEMFFWVGDGPPPVARPSRSSVSSTVPVERRTGAFLPHWTADGATYFVTFRLADAVPASKRAEWKHRRDAFRELEAEGKTRVRESLEYQKAFSENVDAYLDAGDGACLLRDPKAAEIVANALKHFDGERYELLAWVVMPNHVHAVVRPLRDFELPAILHSWKSFSAHAINKALGRAGDVWMDESYDHLVRDEADLQRVVEYTLENPVKAGMKEHPYVARPSRSSVSGTVPVPPPMTETVGDTLDRDGRATYGAEEFERDEAAGKWVEIWNDVFIQYEWQGHPDPSGKGYVKDAMPNLPFASIDTGMGLDRTAFVLGGKKSVYENGAFDGVFRILGELTGDDLDYATSDTPKGAAARIVADHVRNAAFCVADGILPGSTGRGYVVRRLIRRAVLKGQRTLGLSEPFLYRAFEGVVETMGDFYTELEERRATIVETLRNEEEAFRRTLASGIERLDIGLRANFNYFLSFLNDLPGINVEDALPQNINWLRQLGLKDFRQRLSRSEQLAFDHELETQAPQREDIGRLRKQVLSSLEPLLTTSAQREAFRAPYSMKYHGAEAFTLYSTFGFPVEVTQELAAEAGVEVDVEGYEAALKADQALARGAQGEKSAYGDVRKADERAVEDASETTRFTGYCATEGTGRIVRIRPKDQQPTTFLIALDETPFYAESGGQVGDTGTLTLADGTVFHVEDTTKSGGTFWHRVQGNPQDLLGQTVTLKVDAERRRKIQRNHTATHLLQAALREVLGEHVAQAGSRVDPDRLRFDFAHGKALTPDEIEKVERRVVERIFLNEDVTTYEDLPIAEAKARGAMALFGEKYGDKVRMVEVGEFSRELCGGIHVRTAAEIGPFRIVSESSAAGGVRRIEAVTGEAAYELTRVEHARLREAAGLLKAAPNDLVPAVERALREAKEERGKREKAERAAMSGAPAESATTDVNGVTLWRRDFGDVDPKTAAAAVDDTAAGMPNGVVLGAVVTGGKVQFIAKAGAEAVAKGAHAGNLLKEVSRIAGGGGGGRAEFATAGGKDPAKVAEALLAAEGVLLAQLG